MQDIGHYSGIIDLIIILVGAMLYFSCAKVKPRIAKLLLLLTFFVLSETFLVYTDTLIDAYIGNEPVYKIISNLLLAGILTVTHEFSEKKMKRILFSVKIKHKRVVYKK